MGLSVKNNNDTAARLTEYAELLSWAVLQYSSYLWLLTVGGLKKKNAHSKMRVCVLKCHCKAKPQCTLGLLLLYVNLRESPSILSARVPGAALKGGNCVANCKLKCGETLKSTRGKLMNRDERARSNTHTHAHTHACTPSISKLSIQRE